MPDYTFTAPYPLEYPENRDSSSVPLGLVQPGDIRDLDGPPDRWWQETTDEDRARQAAAEAEQAAQQAEAALAAAEAEARQSPGTGTPPAGVEHPADGTWSPPVSNAPGAPGLPAPVPVPPAA